jgi:hypothetical protein
MGLFILSGCGALNGIVVALIGGSPKLSKVFSLIQTNGRKPLAIFSQIWT